jgi:hypothetical protein
MIEPQPPANSSPRDASVRAVDPKAVGEAIRQINGWHQNTPLILVLSSQKRAPEAQVDGGARAVRHVYDDLFRLDHVGISDEARSHYLHMCHGTAQEFPYAIRKPTQNYGKTHQRIIKDTFGQQFLTRVGEGSYTLAPEFAQKVKTYLDSEAPIDLKPLLLYYYWNNLGSAIKVKDLWKAFTEQFGVDRPPYSDIFTCSGLEDDIPTVPASEFPVVLMKQFVLPDEYGTGSFNADFWRRFRTLLEQRLRQLSWQGDLQALTTDVTCALMYDQSLFLLGAPGTGKTTIVLEAILPALRSACGSESDVRFSYHTLTPNTSMSDLFGFQGLDGGWVPGPLVTDLLVPYADSRDPEKSQAPAADDPSTNEPEETSADGELSVPRVLFLDEANRIDIEGVLSPLQAAFDRLQKRLEAPVLALGLSRFLVPRRIWRIFAGNSPAADSGRREQSRPFKRRLVTVIPPDPIESALQSEDGFKRLCLDLLNKAARSDDPEVSEPASKLFGSYTNNSARLEDLRVLLAHVRTMRRVAITVGLVESILLRSACQAALGSEGALDAGVCNSLVALLAGDRAQCERLIKLCDDHRFPELRKLVQNVILAEQPAMAIELDPVL